MPKTPLLFFFQAEDGIRDATVTGVQTCALPISRAIDKLRSMRRRDKTFVAPVDEAIARQTDPAAPNPGVAAEERGLVQSALAQLTSTQRRVIELAFFEGLTQTEIAARLGEPLGTVKTRARSALERLRGILKGERLPAT